MPRQARLDAPGTLHHVMIRGIEKRNIVSNRKDREDFVSRMGDIASDTQTVIYAWALLTNHAHILLRSGPHSLSTFMRRFLTGYAISYNKRHFRHGHLFENRYKSIVCQEDAYFQELIRYIHLNPLRVQLVNNLSELDSYPWAGHSVIVGRIRHEWQDRKHVLSWFGRSEDEAQKAYRAYIHAGVDQGNRPELVGGGLIRSLGGWSQVISARKHGDRDLSDERILGDGDFVDQVIKEADDRLSSQFEGLARKQKTQEIIQKICDQENINVLELKAGSRRRSACRVRSQVAHELVETYGIPLAEVARHVGVSTSAISKMLRM
jgi:putative transposase